MRSIRRDRKSMPSSRNPFNSGQNDAEIDLDSVPSGGMGSHVQPPRFNLLLSPTSNWPKTEPIRTTMPRRDRSTPTIDRAQSSEGPLSLAGVGSTSVPDVNLSPRGPLGEMAASVRDNGGANLTARTREEDTIRSSRHFKITNPIEIWH